MKFFVQPVAVICLSVALFVVSFAYTQEHRRLSEMRIAFDQANLARHALREIQDDMSELEMRAALEHKARLLAEKRLQEMQTAGGTTDTVIASTGK